MKLIDRLIAYRDELNVLIDALKRAEMSVTVDQASHILNQEYGCNVNSAWLFDVLKFDGWLVDSYTIACGHRNGGFLEYSEKPNRAGGGRVNYQVMITPAGIKALGEKYRGADCQKWR